MVSSVPPKGYSNLSVKTETRQRLEKLMREKGFTTINDAIVFLLETYLLCKKIDELEATTRKTYLALLRLIDELGGGEEPRENTTHVKG